MKPFGCQLTSLANLPCRVDLSHHVLSSLSVVTALHLSFVEKFPAMYPSFNLLTGFAIASLFTAASAAPIEANVAKRSASVPDMAGAPVVIGPGTYPRANKLADGSILGTYTAFNGGDTIIETVLSQDNGKSWYVHTRLCAEEFC